MANSQILSNTSNKTQFSLLKRKQMKLEKNARTQLKYIHNRILEHIKMKHFLENHQIDKFLNQLKKCISNVDEIEAFRKKVKCMLLTIKDSIMEFEEAVSTGAITFSPTRKSENQNIMNKKTSQSSSGVSTFGEISSLSSLALTNSNFKTPQNNQSKHESGPNKYRNIISQNDECYMPLNSSKVISSTEITNSLNYADKTTCHSDNLRNRNIHYLQNENNSKSLKENSLDQQNTQNLWTPNENANVLSTNTDITLSSLELTNDHFHTPTNNNTIPSHISINNRANNQVEDAVTQDLFSQFSQPFVPLVKTSKNDLQQKCYSVNIKEKVSANIPPKKPTNNAIQLNNILNNEMNDHDYVNSLNKLSLAVSQINIDQSITSSRSDERNRGRSGEVDIIIEPTLNCSKKQAVSEDLALMNSSSESSEIFLKNLTPNCSIPNRNLESRSNENKQKYSQNFEISTKKQYPIVSTQPSEISKSCNSRDAQQFKHEQKIPNVIKKDSVIPAYGYFSPNSFTQIIQSQHISPLFPVHYNTDNSRGYKRRCTDISSNLQIINGKIISATVETCNSLQSHPLASTEASLRNVTSICCNKNIYDLDKELEQAKEECSKTLNDLTILFQETKKELLKSKNNSILGYHNAKLKFPPGYEHHYKHLDDLLYEFKVNIGIPINIQQYKDQDLFYEEAMSNWEELQQIVQKIKEREKKSRESNKLKN